jgi:hypothetical protein
MFPIETCDFLPSSLAMSESSLFTGMVGFLLLPINWFSLKSGGSYPTAGFD